MIGGAFWTPCATIIGSTSSIFNTIIKALFANNEQGFAYDPNDLTTLYQDAAGTIPVTAQGQLVGLMLDKSKGLVLGDNMNTTGATGWIAGTEWSIAGDTATIVSTGAFTNLDKNLGAAKAGTFYKIDVNIISLSGGTIRCLFGGNAIPVILSAVGVRSFYVPASVTSGVMRFQAGSGVTASLSLSSVVVKELAGNHAYQSVSASRPILQRNATTGAYYLAFDGVDDFLQTNNIDFTATDKVSLFAGVRKLSDATFGAILSSLGGNGTFEMYHPSAAGSNNYVLSASGSTGATYIIANGYVAPHSSVLSAKIDIGLDLRSLSVNGTKFQNSTVNLGTGSFGSYPLFIGRRGGTALPYNGHIYGLIGIGRLTTDVETATLEKLIAKNTGVTLSV